ncbi:MAG: hypothetical protein J6M94_06705 [Prevotella sp.]|nr:hypothetical protein [Prevotella sp.]
MKKTYQMPSIDIVNIRTEAVLAVNSPSNTLDPDKDSQVITPTDDPFNGEFSSKRGGRTVWDDDFEDEEE